MAPHDRRDDDSRGVTRRGFLGSVGAGAVVAATGVAGSAAATPEITDPEAMQQIALGPRYMSGVQ